MPVNCFYTSDYIEGCRLQRKATQHAFAGNAPVPNTGNHNNLALNPTRYYFIYIDTKINKPILEIKISSPSFTASSMKKST